MDKLLMSIHKSEVRLKRFLLISLIIGLAAIFGVVPWLTGRILEQQYQEGLRKVNQRSDLHAAIESFERGFRKSTVRLTLTLHPDSKSSTTLPLVQVITHGPVFFRDKTKAFNFKPYVARIETRLDGSWKERLSELFTHPDPFKFLTFIGFDRRGHTHFSLVPIHQKTDAELKLDSEAIEGHFDHSLTWRAFKGEIHLPQIQLDKNQTRVQLKNSTLQIDSEWNNSVNVGEIKARAAQFSWHEQEKPLFAFDNLCMNSKTSQQQDGKLQAQLTSSMDKALIFNQDIRPEPLAIVLERLSPEALQVMQDFDPKKQPAALLQALLVQLGKTQAHIAIDLPKALSQSITTLISYQLYTQVLGKFDVRSENDLYDMFHRNTLSIYNQLVSNQTLLETPEKYQVKLDFPAPGSIHLNGKDISSSLEYLNPNPTPASTELGAAPAASLPPIEKRTLASTEATDTQK